MKKMVLSVLILSLTLPALALVSESRDAQLKRGAQLYDKWFALTGEKPSENHPAYPQTAKKKGDTTWRCKECHGWDYLGKDGRYAKGSHFTGIKGVVKTQSWSHEGIEKLLGPKGRHDFTQVLGKDDIHALALFLREGQVDMRKAIGQDGNGLGVAENGKPLYQEHCASCHGAQGQDLDFKSKDEGIQGVGWLSRDNPQETLHKILWGHPGSDMPSMWVDAGLSFPQVVDLLTYSQQLP